MTNEQEAYNYVANLQLMPLSDLDSLLCDCIKEIEISNTLQYIAYKAGKLNTYSTNCEFSDWDFNN